VLSLLSLPRSSNNSWRWVIPIHQNVVLHAARKEKPDKPANFRVTSGILLAIRAITGKRCFLQYAWNAKKKHGYHLNPVRTSLCIVVCATTKLKITGNY
jgi:hypothetical protein